jgi:hypothetical protein
MKEPQELTYKGYQLNVMRDGQGNYTGDVIDRQLPLLEAESLADLRREFHAVIDALVAEEMVEEPNLLEPRNTGTVIPLGGGIVPSVETPSVDEFGFGADGPDRGHKPGKREWED